MARPLPRSIRLLRPPGPDGPGLFCILAGKNTTYYVFREIPCEIGGRAFAVHRLGLASLYHVRVGEPDQCSCECLGFLAHDHCKHVLGLKAMVDANLI